MRKASFNVFFPVFQKFQNTLIRKIYVRFQIFSLVEKLIVPRSAFHGRQNVMDDSCMIFYQKGKIVDSIPK